MDPQSSTEIHNWILGIHPTRTPTGKFFWEKISRLTKTGKQTTLMPMLISFVTRDSNGDTSVRTDDTIAVVWRNGHWRLQFRVVGVMTEVEISNVKRIDP